MKIGMGTTMEKPLWTLFKKHYCQKCNARLKVIRVSRLLIRGSDEHKMFFHRRENFPLPQGDFKLKEVKFKCPRCNSVTNILEQYNYEESYKK